MFLKIGVLKNFATVTGKHLWLLPNFLIQHANELDQVATLSIDLFLEDYEGWGKSDSEKLCLELKMEYSRAAS